MRTQKAINDFLDSRIARNLSPTTIQWYKHKLGCFATVCRELPKDPGLIEASLANIRGSPETKHAYFRALRALFGYISQRYEIANPMVKVAPPRCPKKVMATLEPNEQMRLLNSASDLRDRTILTLFVDSGIRTSELTGLCKQHIKTDTVWVRGKSGEREVPISEETKTLLLALIAQDGKDELFLGHKGPLSRHGIYRIIRGYMGKAGIPGPKLGAHRMRHAFGKGYLVNGGDIRSLQEIMGHVNITTTEKYASLNLNDVITKHHRFTPLRAAHAAAQGSLFDTAQALKEAEAILKEGR